MTDPLAAGYALRAPRPDEAPAVHALIAASEIAEFGEATGYSLDDLEGEWRTIDPAQDAWVAVAPDGSLAGYAYVSDRRHVRVDAEGYVHPEHGGRGIGTALVRAAETRARNHVALAPEGARVVAQNWINARNDAARAILAGEGYAPIRHFWRMEIALSDAPTDPRWPEAVAVRTLGSADDERAAHLVVEEAMADHWGHVPIEFDEWIARRRGYGIEPSLWFVAYEGSDPAAVALCSISDGLGWVDTLAVRRPWRGRGLGKALLLHAFADFRRRGLERCALGVDAASPTGATRLYEGVGMRATQEHTVFQKELRPGAELADLDDEGER